MPSYIYNMVDTWNAGATTFSAIKMNVTDTASAAGSLLMDLQVGGTSRFRVTKAGEAVFASNSFVGDTGGSLGRMSFNTSMPYVVLGGSGTGYFGLANTNVQVADVILSRRAAANLRFGAADAAAPVAQTLSVQSVVAGTTNTAGANLTITGSQGTGTGAGGSIIFQVAPAGSPGTVQNALDTALTILGSGDTTFAANKVITGTFFLNSSLTGNDYFFGSNFYVRSNVRLASGIPLGWSSSATAPNNPADLTLFRDAANTLALRNGANAQAFRVYNTYTNASNYERAELSWVSNVARWQSTAVGGTVRNMEIVRGSTSHWLFSVNGSYFGAHLLAGTDNLYDIGASGASRPRNVYVAFLLKSTYIETNASVPAGNGGIAIGQSVINSNASGVISLSNYSAGNDFNRLQFGGTTSSFPALKRSSTTLQARLADDSDFGSIQGKLTTETAYTAGAPTATGYIVLYDSTGTAYKIPAEAL
jgi:hypothetical protein